MRVFESSNAPERTLNGDVKIRISSTMPMTRVLSEGC